MEIPRYPESRTLELSDKQLLEEIFTALQPRVSELTFAGLYLFRNAHAYRLTMVGDSLVIIGQGYDGAPYFLPPLSGAVEYATHQLLAAGLELYGADQPFLARYLPDVANQAAEDRDNFDYLYLRAELAELPGNRFHKKRNRINYFLSRHDCSIEGYTEQRLAGCARLLDEWARVRRTFGSSSLELEIAATREALALAATLGLEGLVALVDGEVKGFVLGEKLNRETSVCHFEKADPFLDGLSPLLDREFNRLLFTDRTYVNREQDLGEAGLREAKLSYRPCELVKKFRVKGRA